MTVSSNPAGTSIDRYSISVTTGGTVEFDIRSWEEIGQDLNGDGELAFIDSFLLLFSDDGSLDAADFLSANDDDDDVAGPFGFGDGSIFIADSFLSLSLAAGDYIVAVAAAPFFAIYDPNTGLVDPTELDNAITAVIAGVDDVPGKPIVLDPLNPGALPGNDHGDYQLTIRGEVTARTVPVPEPSSLVLFGSFASCAGIAILLRWRRGTHGRVVSVNAPAPKL